MCSHRENSIRRDDVTIAREELVILHMRIWKFSIEDVSQMIGWICIKGNEAESYIVGLLVCICKGKVVVSTRPKATLGAR